MTAPYPASVLRARKRWYSQLWVQVLIAMAIGIATGWLYPETGAAMQPLGDAFIKVIRMLIAPLIFCTVVHGIAQMADVASVGRVAIKALIYFEVVSTCALVIGLIVVNLVRPGAGVNADVSTLDTKAIAGYTAGAKSLSAVDLLLHMIPDTAVGAFASGEISRGKPVTCTG